MSVFVRKKPSPQALYVSLAAVPKDSDPGEWEAMEEADLKVWVESELEKGWVPEPSPEPTPEPLRPTQILDRLTDEETAALVALVATPSRLIEITKP